MDNIQIYKNEPSLLQQHNRVVKRKLEPEGENDAGPSIFSLALALLRACGELSPPHSLEQSTSIPQTCCVQHHPGLRHIVSRRTQVHHRSCLNWTPYIMWGILGNRCHTKAPRSSGVDMWFFHLPRSLVCGSNRTLNKVILLLLKR